MGIMSLQDERLDDLVGYRTRAILRAVRHAVMGDSAWMGYPIRTATPPVVSWRVRLACCAMSDARRVSGAGGRARETRSILCRGAPRAICPA
jgi:hypothetical protein